ncbi:cyclic nucleotide-binding domain protein (macronuclear) [Tetrahymena thermophila SB210]|uniref:Cyclic nucleotide-binding domain protein n=1 Tax=Tetrahymena thermophila (strain SB210) TaxID=312017 RepID=I7MET0_TETTS|nr:cyclic nucleotide-binding domain protein [Tetrahymena thermophila SB210]EAR97535.2 cyclic nucleotide-binding domain protein [Tetrahymena thermophila SB210]|eukprot:XP_001017780.2 cyclic nucleotide-binding domain protein [Tetrahymena thermophila SB210]
MIVGALIQQQERDKSLSIHCRSPLANVQSYCMDELMGISRKAKNQETSPQTNKQQNDQNSHISTKDTKSISDEEKVIKILQKPKNLRSFQELMFLYQEFEKLEYFQIIKQRCKELRYREAINALSYKFVEKDDFIIRKNEIGNDFYIIFQGSCFVLDEDDSLTPSQKLAQITSKNLMNNLLDTAKSPSSSNRKAQKSRAGFSNFRQAFQTWNDNDGSNHSDSKQNISSDREDKIVKNQSSKKNSIINSPQLSSRKSVLSQRNSILKIPLADASFRRESLIHSLFKSSIPNLKIIKLLSKGETFGEKSILSKFHKRTAYVQAKEDCHLIYLSKADYLNIIGNEKRQQIEKITDFLSEFKFLEGWQYHDIKQLSQNFYEDKFAKGEYVFKEGDKSQNIYIIKRGEISIQKEVNFQIPQVENLEESRPKNLQKNIEIACLKEGEIFGEEAVIQYESTRCFSAKVKSQKFKLIKINAQKFLDQLWDPNSKKIFLQQASQKLKWRSDRYHSLTQMHLKQVKEKEQLDQKSYKVKPKIKKIIDTPDKQFVLEEKFLSPKSSLNLSKNKNSKTNENILVVNTKLKTPKQDNQIDKEVIKQKFTKQFPIAWLLRQQEVTLKDTFQTSYTSKISDNIQKLRPMTSLIDQKRSEIFSMRIKSGQIKSSESTNIKNIQNINNSNQNKQTKALENSNSPNNSLAQSTQLKKFSLSVTNSPTNFFIHQNRKSNFTEELNQLLQTSSNHSKFYPQSQRSSDSKIPYFDTNQPNKIEENLFDQSLNQLSRPTSSQTTPKMSKQASFEGQQTQRNTKLQHQGSKIENSLEEKELIKKQKDFIKNKSTLLRGFSATQKRQNFFHTMSMGEEEEQKKILYLRKFLEENKEQTRLQKTKRVSLDYHIDKEKNKQKLWKSQSINLTKNNFSSPRNQNQNKSQNQDQKAKKSSISSDQFSLFEDEYSKFSKEEQERLRYQEIQFDEVLDNNLSAQMSILEKDMMETLSMKGQQITSQLNQEIQKQNNDFILNLFLKKGKYKVNSPRLQRTIDYIKILKEEDESKKYLQEQIKLALNNLKQESNSDSPKPHFEEYDLNFIQSKKQKQKQELLAQKQQENTKNQSQLQESQKIQIFTSNSSQKINEKQASTQTIQNNPKQQHRRIKKSSFAMNSSQNFLTLRPQTAASSYKFQSLTTGFQEKNNQNQLKQLLAKSKIPNTSRVSSRPQTSKQDEEELLNHKKIIENQLKRQKNQTSAFEVMNKLIFESDDNKIQNTKIKINNYNSTQNLLSQKPQQSSSVYDPTSKKLFIHRQLFYNPK